MRNFGTPALAVAALALVSIATPALAGSPYYDPIGGMMVDDAPVATVPYGHPDTGYLHPRPYGAGMYNCTLGEKRTRMQKRACGPLRPEY